MEITFSQPTESDVVLIYETYREDEEPDSPTIPFVELTDEQKLRTTQGFSKVIQIALIDGVKAGWVTVIDRSEEPSINIGFGVFPKHRGKGFAAVIVNYSVKILRKQKLDRPITAETRAENAAAIKTLENAGFIQDGTRNSPATGKSTTPIVFTKYKFP